MRPDNESGVCPREDEVILSFLDGEPGTAPAELAEHLGACRSCARALEESRALDALLAAQTSTEISEKDAERLLGGITGTARAAESPRGIGAGLALAAGLILALGSGWLLGPVPELRVIAERSRPSESPRRSESAVAGFRVPSTADLASWRAAPMPLGKEELLRALRSRSQTLVDRARLRAHARRLLETGRSRIPGLLLLPSSPDGHSLGPRVLGRDGELKLAAAEWLLAEVRRGRSRGSEALRVGRALLAADGLLRRRLTELLRSEEYLLAPLLGELESRPDMARLAAALGTRGVAKRLARLPFRDQAGAARAARRQGDLPSLLFLLEQYLEASSRSEDVRELGLCWFDGLGPRELSSLGTRLIERVQSSPQKLHRDLCIRLQLRLGLFERASSE